MNSQGLNSTTNNQNLNSIISSLPKKEEGKKANQVDEHSSSVVKNRTGRKRIFFNLLIGYK